MRRLGLLLAALILVVSAAAPAPADAVPVKQRLCINIHNNYGGLFSNTAQMKADIDYTGIDCVRDALPPNDVDRNTTAWNALDVDVIAYCGGYFTTWQWEGTEGTCVAELDNRVPRAVAAEGMNEPYCGDYTGLQNNKQRLIDHMTRIRDAALPRGLDAYSVALCQPDWWGAAPISGIVTADHTYPPWAASPNCPWPDDSTNTFQLGWYKQYPIGATNRWASTEAGRNLGCSTTQVRHAQVNVVSALLGLANGWERFALYQLYDESPQSSGTCCTYGWWSDTHVKRLVADAFHNMMGYLGNTSTEANFGYSVSDPANQVQTQAFVDPSGQHYIALWNRSEIAARSVTITLNTAASVGVIDPIVSSTATTQASSTSHVISLSNDPVIVQVAAGSQADTTPPSQPGNPTQTGATQTTISMSWAPSTDNVGVTSYVVYRNGAGVTFTNGSTTSFTDTGLTCGTSYTYAVRAADAAGNLSTAGTASLATSACSPPPSSETLPDVADSYTDSS
jgi:hypothetical protein